jgi:hypothetical protein
MTYDEEVLQRLEAKVASMNESLQKWNKNAADQKWQDYRAAIEGRPYLLVPKSNGLPHPSRQSSQEAGDCWLVPAEEVLNSWGWLPSSWERYVLWQYYSVSWSCGVAGLAFGIGCIAAALAPTCQTTKLALLGIWTLGVPVYFAIEGAFRMPSNPESQEAKNYKEGRDLAQKCWLAVAAFLGVICFGDYYKAVATNHAADVATVKPAADKAQPAADEKVERPPIDVFNYLAVALSMIVALGLTTLLTSIGKDIHQPREFIKRCRVHQAWVGIIVMLHVQLWWSFWAYHKLVLWHYWPFLGYLAAPTLLFLVAYLIYPDIKPEKKEDLEAHFYRYNRVTFGCLAGYLLVVLVMANVVKPGCEHWSATVIRILGIAVAFTAAWTKEPRIHVVLAPLFAVLLAVFILINNREPLQL